MFQQLFNPSDAEDSSLREKTCKFVASKLPLLSEQELNSETEKFIVETVKKLMATADMATFAGLLAILSTLKSMKLLTVRQQMVETIEQKAEISKSSSYFDNEKVISSFYLCCEQAVPFFSVSSGSSDVITILLI